MITLNTPIQLGHKAFLFFLVQKTLAPLVVIFVAMIVGIMGNTIVQGIVGLLSVAGMANSGTPALVISLVTNGVFLMITLALVVGIFGFVVSTLQYRNYTLVFEDFNLSVNRGIISTKQISIPYRQIQDVAIERDLNHRLLGLARLVLNTAGHSDDEKGLSEVSFEPIDFDLANEARELLERKIGIQIIQSERANTEDTSQGPHDPPLQAPPVKTPTSNA